MTNRTHTALIRYSRRDAAVTVTIVDDAHGGGEASFSGPAIEWAIDRAAVLAEHGFVALGDEVKAAPTATALALTAA